MKILEFFAKCWPLSAMILAAFIGLAIFEYEGYWVFAFVAAIYFVFTLYQSYHNREF